MKTKSTVGRLITRLSEWRESGVRVKECDGKIKIFLLIFVKSINLRAINLLM